MMVADDDNEPFDSSVVSKLPPVLGFTTNTVSSIDTNDHSFIMMSHAPSLDMWRHTDLESIKWTCRDFARGHLFCYTKFWGQEMFGLADAKKGGLPYLLASHCHLSKENILGAWRFFARLLQCTHTDHQSSVIKKIKKTYIGKLSSSSSWAKFALVIIISCCSLTFVVLSRCCYGKLWHRQLWTWRASKLSAAARSSKQLHALYYHVCCFHCRCGWMEWICSESKTCITKAR